jgi:exportin-2 (importin alpha re-exporter)
MQYVFQILAQLLESSPGDVISQNYTALLAPLLQPAIWDTKGNAPGCTRLLSAVIPRCAPHILAEKKLEPILGIFQNLVSRKKLELYAFDVLEAVVKTFEP